MHVARISLEPNRADSDLGESDGIWCQASGVKHCLRCSLTWRLGNDTGILIQDGLFTLGLHEHVTSSSKRRLARAERKCHAAAYRTNHEAVKRWHFVKYLCCPLWLCLQYRSAVVSLLLCCSVWIGSSVVLTKDKADGSWYYALWSNYSIDCEFELKGARILSIPLLIVEADVKIWDRHTQILHVSTQCTFDTLLKKFCFEEVQLQTFNSGQSSVENHQYT